MQQFFLPQLTHLIKIMMSKQGQKIMQKNPRSMKQNRTNIENTKHKQQAKQSTDSQIKQCKALEQITNTLQKPKVKKLSQKHHPNNHSFQYYMSEVQRELMRRKQKINHQLDQQNIFINHVMYCLYIFKTNRYISHSYEPTATVNLNLKSNGNQLGKNNAKNVVIFDLDETLIHSLSLYEEMGQEGKQKYYEDQVLISITENIKINQKKVSSVAVQHEEGCNSQNFEQKINRMDMSSKKQSKIRKYATKLKVNIRPFAKQVLKRLSQYFTIGIFTAAEQQYTNQILKILDPTSSLISFRLYRQHCTPLSSCAQSKPQYVKDLRIIQKIELNKVVLVDNSPISYLYQPDNGIPIIPFVAESEDDQLLKLQSFLHRYLLTCEDVRSVVKKMFRSKEYQKFNTVREVVEKVGKFNQFLI